jgi:hypothetical protein
VPIETDLKTKIRIRRVIEELEDLYGETKITRGRKKKKTEEESGVLPSDP